VDQDILVQDLELAAGADLRFSSSVRTVEVTGETRGGGFVTFTAKNDSALFVNSEVDQSISYHFRMASAFNQRGQLRVGGSGKLTAEGHFESLANGLHILLDAGARFEFGAQCTVNNNLPDLVNARPITTTGSGLSSRLSFHPEFHADLADPAVTEDLYPYSLPADDPGDGSYIKPVGGFSTFRMNDLTVETRASQNLASIHKYSGAPTKYTHHGLWMFDLGSDLTRWVVSGSAQEYDGGIYFSKDWELVTEENYEQAAIWHAGVNVGFGSRSNGHTLTKSGPANFILSGTQAYHPGTTIRVSEGGLILKSDPDIRSSPDALANNGYMAGTGNHLLLNVDAGAHVAVLPPATSTYRVHSADVQGDLITQVHGARSSTAALLESAGDLSVTGEIHISYQGVMDKAEYRILVCGGSLNWSPSSMSLPSGWQLEQEGSSLWLRPDGSPLSYSEWIALQPAAGGPDTGPSDIPAGEQYSNLHRYAYDIPSATAATQAQTPAILQVQGEMHFEVTRPAASRRPDLSYRIQKRNDLLTGSWEDWDGTAPEVIPEGDMERIRLNLSSDAVPDALFLRMEVNQL